MFAGDNAFYTFIHTFTINFLQFISKFRFPRLTVLTDQLTESDLIEKLLGEEKQKINS